MTLEKRNQPRQRSYWIPLLVIVGVASLALIVGLTIALTTKQTSPYSEQEVRTYLISNQISSTESLSLRGSPQSKAATFMARYSSRPSPGESAVKWTETYTMAVFYYGTHGDDWALKLGFIDPVTDVCNWNIESTDVDSPIQNQGASCGSDGRINRLEICKCSILSSVATMRCMPYVILSPIPDDCALTDDLFLTFRQPP